MKRKTITLLVMLVIVFLTSTAFESKNAISLNKAKDLTINDFNSFLGLKYGDKVTDVKKVMGDPSGGELVEDESSFMHYYKNTKRVPVTVYTNSKSKKVETVFMEILGLEETFEQDVKKAKQDFLIQNSHAKLYGKRAKEVLNIFGVAYDDTIEDSSVEEDVRTLLYYSDDDKIALTLKFYPSQGNVLSSIMVDWFY